MRLSPTQQDALRHLAASPSGKLVRIPGGFWATPETPLMARSIPKWNVTIQTVRAMESLGLLERREGAAPEWAADRFLTDAGRSEAGKAGGGDASTA